MAQTTTSHSSDPPDKWTAAGSHSTAFSCRGERLAVRVGTSEAVQGRKAHIWQMSYDCISAPTTRAPSNNHANGS